MIFGCVLGGFGAILGLGVFCGFHDLSCGVSWMFLFLVGLI